MKLSIATLFVSVASIAFAQDLTGLPQCSLSCFVTAIQASGCALTDTYCVCTKGKDSITASVTPCVIKACTDTSDQAKVEPAALAICSKAVAAGSASATASGSSATKTAASSGGSTSTSSQAAAQTTNAGGSNKVEMMGAGAGLLAALLL